MSKVCPLMSHQGYGSSEALCKEEDCAWYDVNKHQCILLTLGDIK